MLFRSGLNLEMLQKNFDDLGKNLIVDFFVITTEENLDKVACLETDNTRMFEAIYSLFEKLFIDKNFTEKQTVKNQIRIIKKESF